MVVCVCVCACTRASVNCFMYRNLLLDPSSAWCFCRFAVLPSYGRPFLIHSLNRVRSSCTLWLTLRQMHVCFSVVCGELLLASHLFVQRLQCKCAMLLLVVHIRRPFSALTLLVGWQEGYLDCRKHGSHAYWKVLETSGIFPPSQGPGNQCVFWKVREIWCKGPRWYGIVQFYVPLDTV